MRFNKTDYAINKKEEEQIIYISVTGEVIAVSKEQFLVENPKKSAEDFFLFKDFSDMDYYVSDLKEGKIRKKEVGLTAELAEFLYDEEDFVEAAIRLDEEIAACQRLRQIINENLTEVQKRRIKMAYWDGMTVREIAEKEGASHPSVVESLQAAKRKILIILRKV